MDLETLTFANLTESELKKIKDTEVFLNGQPDHQALQEKGGEVYLLAFVRERVEE